MHSIVEESLRLAARMSQLGSESAIEVLVRARELEARGKPIIHLEIGEPDFATPPNVVEAACKAVHGDWTHYGPPAGLPQLRDAIAEYQSRQLGIPIDPSEVVVTPGGKPIMFFTILALVDKGDEVLHPDPGYPIYESMIKVVGGKPVPYALHEDRDFEVDIDEIAGKNQRPNAPRNRELSAQSDGWHNEPTANQSARGSAGQPGDLCPFR